MYNYPRKLCHMIGWIENRKSKLSVVCLWTQNVVFVLLIQYFSCFLKRQLVQLVTTLSLGRPLLKS